MTSLTVGSAVPDVTAVAYDGHVVRISEFANRKLWLCLFRYAACPFCSVRLHRLIAEQERIARAGIVLVAAFPSPKERVAKYITKFNPSFQLICDPEQQLYSAFGVGASWTGLAKSAAMVHKVAHALALAPNNPSAVDGPIHRMPAEFLIDVGGLVALAHYGTSADDGIDIEKAIAWGNGSS